MSNMDHPRVCREKLPYLPSGFRGWGSPPRVRGKGEGCPAERAEERITPACAGKRGQRVTQYCRYWDHPRMCGEK